MRRIQATLGVAALAAAGLCTPARAQDSDTHPAEVQGVWAHQEQPDATGMVEWAVIRFADDGSYRAARVRLNGQQAQRVGEVVTGQWAVVHSEPRGASLCTRPQSGTFSHCNGYTVASSPRELRWNELSFVAADSALVARLELANF
jgi:hypothetical protein